MSEALPQPPAQPNPDTLIISQLIFPALMPVFTCDLGTHRLALDLAKIGIDELRAADPNPLQSNVMAQYVSPWDSHMKNPKFQPICEIVRQIALHVSKTFLTADLHALNMDYFVKDCWGIIYEKADHTRKHNHFPADISCVLYIEAEPNCAPLLFDNGVQIQPTNNLLIMFPGVLNHEVPATPGRRVCVAMNLFKMAKLQ